MAGLEQNIYFVRLSPVHATANTDKGFGKKSPLWFKLEEQPDSWLDGLFSEKQHNTWWL